MELKVYIGWDSREKVAYDVCRYSISHNTHAHAEILPLTHKQLRRQGWFNRPWFTVGDTGNMIDGVDGKPFSTEFSHTRFLVPALCGYKGWALFMDCDMVWDADIKELFALADPKYAAMCVKHNHKPADGEKMDGVPQGQYYRKNWSSFVLWNCAHPANRLLTRDYVSTRPGGDMHAFSWLDDGLIGALPTDYNWIEGNSPSNIAPRVVHYTAGGPWFDGYSDVKHAKLWWKYYERWLRAGEYEPVKETVTVNYGLPV